MDSGLRHRTPPDSLDARHGTTGQKATGSSLSVGVVCATPFIALCRRSRWLLRRASGGTSGPPPKGPVRYECEHRGDYVCRDISANVPVIVERIVVMPYFAARSRPPALPIWPRKRRPAPPPAWPGSWRPSSVPGPSAAPPRSVDPYRQFLASRYLAAATGVGGPAFTLTFRPVCGTMCRSQT